ncbi:hypothetical protein AGOR_G00069010 [Albula goreensis]|uniref:TYW2 N-terminal domain-containing protein n=1 Tax=Albula goreensis TaxID=1534307 RepID=A0A8T3DQJ5_9TELE|nr:hypothetical protein AGOR_G00069010 [Albula goreensis]
MNSVPALKVQQCYAQTYRKHLEAQGIWQPKLRAQKYSDGTVALPIVPACVPGLDLHTLQLTVSPGSAVSLVYIQVPALSRKESVTSDSDRLSQALQELLASHGEGWSNELREDVPAAGSAMATWLC